MGATSGPSVASSSCLTSRKIQTTSDAASIISDAIRNAWVAPSVNVAWKYAASRKLATLLGARVDPGRLGELGSDQGDPLVDVVQRHRAQRGEPEGAADLLHGVEDARADAGVLRP